ncbi:Packaging protein UL32-like protein [Bienertia sinuspersici]
MGRYNYPRRHSKQERETNPPGRLPSYKSYDTRAGFSKKPRLFWFFFVAHIIILFTFG